MTSSTGGGDGDADVEGRAEETRLYSKLLSSVHVLACHSPASVERSVNFMTRLIPQPTYNLSLCTSSTVMMMMMMMMMMMTVREESR